MKNLWIQFRLFLFFTLLLGLGYPLSTTGFARLLFRDQASGSLIVRDGRVIGSRLIAQKFEKSEYFWPRPSAVDYSPMPSGGSNLSVASRALKKLAGERRDRQIQAHGVESGMPPQDLWLASASGLDPEISVEAARYQVRRVARARGLDPVQVDHWVTEQVRSRGLGFLGEPTVNVLELNLALDRAH